MSRAGWLGRFTERLVLASYVRALIDKRNRYLEGTRPNGTVTVGAAE